MTPLSYEISSIFFKKRFAFTLMDPDDLGDAGKLISLLIHLLFGESHVNRDLPNLQFDVSPSFLYFSYFSFVNAENRTRLSFFSPPS